MKFMFYSCWSVYSCISYEDSVSKTCQVNKILPKAWKIIFLCEYFCSVLGSWGNVRLNISTYHVENLYEINYCVSELLWLKG